jgi:multidrug efflux pump subunit AcrA (membrane-fusion protein)
VYVVDANKSAQPKRIELVYSFGDQAVVKGLEPGELVIVDGKQNLRPGMKVRDTRAGAGNNDRAA